MLHVCSIYASATKDEQAAGEFEMGRARIEGMIYRFVRLKMELTIFLGCCIVVITILMGSSV